MVERWTSAGTFSIRVPTGARHAELLSEGRLIKSEGFWGIIDGVTMDWDASGPVTTVVGRQLKGLAADRITIPPLFAAVAGAQGYDTANGTTEAIMKHFVDANMGPGAAEERRVSGLEIAPDQGRGMAGDKYMSRHEGLDDVLQALGEAASLGWDIVPDLERGIFVFDVCPGEDHTAGQRDRKRVIFDVDRKTALSQRYQHSAEDARNYFYATLSGSEFADETLTASYMRTGEAVPLGIRRREKHLSISVQTPEAGKEYEEMARKVQVEAESYRPVESFTCRVAQRPYIYGLDYRVGDLVTVRAQAWGVTMDAHITEVRSTWTDGGVDRDVTFGAAALNIFGRLRRQIRQGG